MLKQRLKFIISFILLTATLCVAVGFIVHTARQVSGVTAVERRVAAQRIATDRLLTALLTADACGEEATLRYADDSALDRYLLSIDSVDRTLIHFRRVTPDTTQRLRVDTLRALVRDKCIGVTGLIDALRRERNKGESLQRRIDALRSGAAPVSVTAPVAAPVVERGEQVVISRRRRGFFRRLADAFKGSRDDTLNVRTTQRAAADTTVAAVNVSDTLADILSDVHRTLDRDARRQVSLVSRSSDALRSAGAVITQRINALLGDIGREQARRLQTATAAERLKRTSRAWQMGGLALAAVFAAVGFFVWAWRDMNRANRYRRELEAANARAEALMRRREQLLLTISHDIKAPVNAIIGYLDLLRPAGDGQADALKAIGSSAQHLRRLVGDLLDYHRLEAGDISPDIAPTPLVGLLTDIVSTFRPAAAAKGLRLDFTTALPAGSVIDTDAFRLRQIIDNLLSNAIKYTATGSVSLSLTADSDGHPAVTVADTGCGLTPADCQRVFAPFTRVKGSEGQEGTGLGLSITQRLAELLGGAIGVSSRVGEGSRFTLTLTAPLRRSAEPSAATPAVTGESALPAVPQSPRVVALLDDDSVQLQLATAMLRNVLPEAELHPFHVPSDLMEWLGASGRPDVILTDFEMPVATGLDVLRHVRQLPAPMGRTPVVTMTSHTLLPAAHFLDEGFAAVLFKPFTQNGLRSLFCRDAVVPAAPPPPAEEAPSPTVPGKFAPLLAFAAGDADAERAILGQFAADCRTHLSRLDAAVAATDKGELCQIAHKMLPTFTLIDATDGVTDTLRGLERRRGETAWTPADTAAAATVRDALAATINQLKAFMQP